MDWTILHTDGGSRGNPGPGAYAFILSRPGQDDVRENDYMPSTTNNVAEYTAVVKGLEKARELGVERVLVKSDSELMVKQMNGQYKVKNEGLMPLYQQACKLRSAFQAVQFQHVRREQNKEADRLCNDAMDFRGSTTYSRPNEIKETPFAVAPVADPPVAAPPTVKKPKKASSLDRRLQARREAIEILTLAKEAWEDGKEYPTAADAWEDLLALLRRQEMLRDEI